MKKKREPSNALVSSEGYWTQLRPDCHPDQGFKIIHSTTHGIYCVQCAQCGRTLLRIEVGRAR
jgi:hypothetical protein